MARDYKPAKKKSRKKKLPAVGWGWLATGLAIGLVIGLGVYFFQRSKTPAADVAAVAVTPAKNSKAEKPAAKTKTVPEEEPKSRFDFYTLLPEMEVVVPEPGEAANASSHIAKVDKPGVYILQVGSFRRFEEADSMKASLALLGIEARIQTVSINHEDVWHRVRLGPYDNLEKLHQTRRQLRKNNIEFMLLKIKI